MANRILFDNNKILSSAVAGANRRIATSDCPADCCAPPGWYRAVACNTDSVPQIITAPVNLDHGQCRAAAGCELAGNAIVYFNSRCYVLDATTDLLPVECRRGPLIYKARVYPELPDGQNVNSMICPVPTTTCASTSCGTGCCLQTQSQYCVGTRGYYRTCPSGRDVTYTYHRNWVYLDQNLANGTFRRNTRNYHYVIRGQCIGGQQVFEVSPDSYFEYITERTGFPLARSIYYYPDSRSNVTIANWRYPGNTQLVPNGSLYACDSITTVPYNYRRTITTVSGCLDGTFNDLYTTLPPQTGPQDSLITDEYRDTWFWSISDPCEGLGALGFL